MKPEQHQRITGTATAIFIGALTITTVFSIIFLLIGITITPEITAADPFEGLTLTGPAAQPIQDPYGTLTITFWKMAIAFAAVTLILQMVYACLPLYIGSYTPRHWSEYPLLLINLLTLFLTAEAVKLLASAHWGLLSDITVSITDYTTITIILSAFAFGVLCLRDVINTILGGDDAEET